MNAPSSTTSSPNQSASGRWFLCGIGLSLAVIGGIFIWLMARSYLRAQDMRDWPQMPCTILSSTVAERRHDPNSPLEYQHQLSFGYEWQGSAYTSDRLSLRGSKWSAKRQMVMQSQQSYPTGSQHLCYINPNLPTMAILQPDSLAAGYSIWFPCLFVIGGLGIAARAVLHPRPDHKLH